MLVGLGVLDGNGVIVAVWLGKTVGDDTKSVGLFWIAVEGEQPDIVMAMMNNNAIPLFIVCSL